MYQITAASRPETPKPVPVARIEPIVHAGKLTVDLDKRTVSANGRQFHVTAMEYRVLELLSQRKERIVSRDMLLNHLYGGRGNEPDPKILDVFVCKLRKRLARATGGERYIQTLWGRGYVFREPPEPIVWRRRA
jgi:two-component system cell cycle response regulator CtrA